jgi:AcrR family transcriptional regulator
LAQRPSPSPRARAKKAPPPKPAKTEPAPRGGSRRGAATRQSILDAAERCLAEGDFDGVSLRAIGEAASVDIALLNYHFGSKENLVREVIGRRARLVHEARVLALEEARHAAGTASPTVDAIVNAFLEPWLKLLAGGDPGWQNYNRLLCQLAMMPKYLPLTSDTLDLTAIHFINALRTAMPKADPQSVYWGYMFMLGAMIQVMAGTGRVERLSHGLCRSDDIVAVLRKMVPFVAGGLRELEQTGARHPPQADRRLAEIAS